MKHRIVDSWNRLERLLVLDADSPGQRRSRATLVVASSLSAIAGVILPFDISLSFVLGNRSNPSHWTTLFSSPFLFSSNTIGRETLMRQGDIRQKNCT